MAGGAAAGAAAGAAIGAAVGIPLAKMREPARAANAELVFALWSAEFFLCIEFRSRGKQPRPPARTRLSPLQPDRTAF